MIRIKELSEINYIMIFLIVGGVLFVIIGGIIIYLMLKIRRLNKNARKKTKKKN